MLGRTQNQYTVIVYDLNWKNTHTEKRIKGSMFNKSYRDSNKLDIGIGLLADYL